MTGTHFDLSGRTALVVGGAGVIGRTVAAALATLGAQVTIADLATADSAACAAALPPVAGGSHRGLDVDCASVSSMQEFCGSFADEQLDIFVHCVGLTSHVALPGYAAPWEEQSTEAWQQSMAVNLDSAFVLSQGLREALLRSPHGSMIFVSSIYGSVAPQWSLYDGTGMGNPIAYGVAKAGMNQLVRYLATLYAPTVRVNGLAPGGLQRHQAEAFQTRYCDRTPLGRMATPDDLIGPVQFLASDAAQYVTGQILTVDGGFSLI